MSPHVAQVHKQSFPETPHPRLVSKNMQRVIGKGRSPLPGLPLTPQACVDLGNEAWFWKPPRTLVPAEELEVVSALEQLPAAGWTQPDSDPSVPARGAGMEPTSADHVPLGSKSDLSSSCLFGGMSTAICLSPPLSLQ